MWICLHNQPLYEVGLPGLSKTNAITYAEISVLRQFDKMFRFTWQLVRRNIKPLILIVSFLTFIWLIIDTAHRPEFVRHASKHSFRFGNNANEPAEHWFERTLEQFLELLELDSNVTADESRNSFEPLNCPRSNTLFTAFTGSTLEESLWHYFSLVAIQNSIKTTSEEYQAQIMLTNGTSVELGTLFER